MTQKISLYYFPLGLRIAVPVIIAAAGYLIYLDYRVWAIILIFLGLFILTAKYVTIIDLDKKEFADAFEFYWIDFVNERKKFTTINKIVVTKGNYQQKVTSRIQDRQYQWSDYTGTMIYDEIGELALTTRQDKKELLDVLRVYATFLKVEIEDRSVRNVNV